MGSNFSFLLYDPCACSLLFGDPDDLRSKVFAASSECSSQPSTPNLGDLPENCAALVLAYLDPLEICKLARINRAFRSASWADFVWDSKLPSNYEALVERLLCDSNSNAELSRKMGKREIFAFLSQTKTFDAGTKRAWVDKKTGGLCLSISAKGLTITGIDDRRYWNHIPTEESRFGSIAYLRQIWWFEVGGQMEFPFPAGTYSIFFRIQLGRAAKSFGRRICNTEHVHGWDIKPVRFQLWTSDGQHVSSQYVFEEAGKWALYHVGDFTVDGSKPTTKVQLSVTQIDCTHTKGGLCLDSVIVCPCTYQDKSKVF